MDPELIQKFLDQIRLRAMDDAYIDVDEEKEIMSEALKMGFSLDDAQSVLRQGCQQYGYGRESELSEIVEICLQQFCANDGKIDIDEFNDAIGIGVNLLKRNATNAKVNHLAVENIAYKVITKNRYAIQGKLKKHLKKNLGFDI
ncbi:hypothetical protein KKF91_15130 [Myxococcota bacterium]|nr:hypothetical protein [Myxococcota bacterium]MBU1431873.1 hypothetical protein [Myxococcota bacterium]MBU1898023.1 hypothetical protein [Myxococcota bacterium]